MRRNKMNVKPPKEYPEPERDFEHEKRMLDRLTEKPKGLDGATYKKEFNGVPSEYAIA